MSNLMVMFIGLSIINVVFSTVRSITTIKCGKYIASLVSAGYFAFYNIVLIYTVADFPMWQKCVITFGCNLFGVFIVKLVEEKIQKDRLWKIEFTLKTDMSQGLISQLESIDASYNYTVVGKYTSFNIYCSTKEETNIVHKVIDNYKGKYFIAESKTF